MVTLGGKGEVVLGGKQNLNVGAVKMWGILDMNDQTIANGTVGTFTLIYTNDIDERTTDHGIHLRDDLLPETDNVPDLGSSSLEFKNAFFDGYVQADDLVIDQSVKFSKISSITGNLTVAGTEHLILCDTSGGALTVTLPALSASRGRVLVIKKTTNDANAVTIDGDGAETIDGGATNSEIDAQYDYLVLLGGSSEWHIIGRMIA